jgi:hypothetical protein
LYSVRRASARSLLPALLAGLQHFVEVAGGTNLEDGAVFEGGMLGYELVSMIHVAGFEDENAAELFLGFGVRTVRRGDFAVLRIEG